VYMTWMYQLKDSPHFDLFSGVMGQNVKIQFWGNYGGTNRNPCTQTLTFLCAQSY